MKEATARKNLLPGTPRAHHLSDDDTLSEPYRGVEADAALFFRHINKAAGIERKQIAHGMQVNDTTVDRWCSGERGNPVERARNFCQMLRDRKRHDLIVAVLLWIAGGEFEGTVLSESQTEALRQISKAVEESSHD